MTSLYGKYEGASLKSILIAAGCFPLCGPADAGAISSAYTDIDMDMNCSVLSTAEDGGDFVDFVCDGWRGYPVLSFSGDLRESVFYGFPPDGDPSWESFSAFNSAGAKIEWRIETEGSTVRPFATIRRWFVSADPENPENRLEILVVSKVAQVEKREGCVVGMVRATGNATANDAARRMADEHARSFACGRDHPVKIGEVPDFSSGE